MRAEQPGKHDQSGIALIALLVLIVLAGGYAFYRSENISAGRIQEQGKLLHQLARAKEALIAYAIIDTKRPGRLLCPDIIGSGISPLLTRDDCDAYGGWLPGKTLDLTDTSDGYGSNFHYFLSPLFGGDRISPVLNSETTTNLRLDLPLGSASNDIAALIIATRGPLDIRNADDDEYFYNGASDSPDDNDVVVAITRQELMAAVEQRIANELRTCLEHHAVSADNLQHTYPWPAPLSNTVLKGAAMSLFGMVPDTQPGNPETTLKDSITKLGTTKIALNSASTAAEQLTAAYQLQEQAADARALYDRFFLAAVDLESKANLARNAFESLDTAIVSTTVNAETYTTQSSSLPAAIEEALPSLAELQNALENSGFDLFLVELQAKNTELKSRIDTATAAPSTANFDKLITPVNLFKNSILEYAWTSNPEIESLIASAYAAAINAATAVNLARKSSDADIIQEALSAATKLQSSNKLVETAILASRINIDANEVAFRAERISASIAGLLDSVSNQQLILILKSTQTLVSTLTTNSAPINAAQSASRSALVSALSAATAGSDPTLIGTNLENASTQLKTLATALANIGDNIALETIKSVTTSLSIAKQNVPKTLTGGKSLRAPIKTVIYWSKIAASQAVDLARLARKGITAKDDNDTSAYTAARKLLASLDGDGGTIALLEKSNKSTSEATSTEAREALNKTQNLLSVLLDAASKLDASLETSMAKAAVPTVWYGNSCAFLKPAAGSSTWWTANGWANLFFYQISDRIRPETGKLTVNGSGQYRTVVLAAGKALDKQIRSVRETNSFLEYKNQDASRNADAQAPVTQFSSSAVSATFNDRLSY